MASVLDDLVLDGHKQIPTSPLLPMDLLFSIFLILLTNKSELIQLQRYTKLICNPYSSSLAMAVVDTGNDISSTGEDKR